MSWFIRLFCHCLREWVCRVAVFLYLFSSMAMCVGGAIFVWHFMFIIFVVSVSQLQLWLFCIPFQKQCKYINKNIIIIEP